MYITVVGWSYYATNVGELNPNATFTIRRKVKVFKKLCKVKTKAYSLFALLLRLNETDIIIEPNQTALSSNDRYE